MAKPTLYTPELIRDYRAKGYWEDTTLSDIWNRNAEAFPDREAIVDSRTRLTWKQANTWIDRLALGFLELGFKKDELIVLQLPNSVELCLLRVALEKAGMLYLPVLRTWRHREMEHTLKQAGAAGVVIRRAFRGFDFFQMIQEIRPLLPELRQVFVAGDDVPEGAVAIQKMIEQPLEKKYPREYLENTKCKADEFSLVASTSGTTGLPKFIEFPICSRIYIAKKYQENTGLSDKDVVGAFGPATGGPNHPAYFSAPIVHAKVVMLEHFSAVEAFQSIEKEKVSFIGVVPAQLTLMLNDPRRLDYDLSSLRVLFCSAAVLPPKIGMEVEEKLNCSIIQTYGTMDGGGLTVNSIEDPVEIRLASAGRVIEGNEVQLLDDDGNSVLKGEAGEIVGKGPTMVSGYYRDAKTTEQVWSSGGWYKTGDIGRFDENGNLLIVGRKRDLIIRGGQNIYPVEIESILLVHPKVSSAAVVKMPNPVMGEAACAYIAPRAGETMTFEEMNEALKAAGIAAYKLPERLEILKELPLLAGGQKIDKKKLEKDIAEKLMAEGIG